MPKQETAYKWTKPYFGVTHLTITVRNKTHVATVSARGNFAEAYIYRQGSPEQYLYGPRTFFKGECINLPHYVPNCEDPVASAKQWAEHWIPQ
ncbi:MAG TPA: hypothetical protein VGE45_01085 [Chloroflexia bacterium]|jgi:hypothetical protein